MLPVQKFSLPLVLRTRQAKNNQHIERRGGLGSTRIPKINGHL